MTPHQAGSLYSFEVTPNFLHSVNNLGWLLGDNHGESTPRCGRRWSTPSISSTRAARSTSAAALPPVRHRLSTRHTTLD